MTRTLQVIRLGGVDAVKSLRALGALGVRLGGEYALAGQIIAARLDGLPDARLARRDAAIVELAALAHACEPGSERAIARAVAKKLWRYETTPTRWHAEQKMLVAPLVHGEEGRLLHLILKADGAIGSEAIRKILANARNAGNSVGNRLPLFDYPRQRSCCKIS